MGDRKLAQKNSVLFTSVSIVMLFLGGCATDPSEVEQRQQSYETSARVNDKIAEDWRNMGNDTMAEYHTQEADKASHNRFAAGCGFFGFLIFDVLFDSDACDRK